MHGREGRVACALVFEPTGIGKTQVVAELAVEAQRAGAAVLYLGGGEVTAAALATFAEVEAGPTLLVLDYADGTPPSVLDTAAAPASRPASAHRRNRPSVYRVLGGSRLHNARAPREAHMRMRTLLVSLIAATASAAIAAPANAHPTVPSDAVSAWNETAGDAALASCLAPANNPLHESRMYAMTHLAIHDAVNAIDRRSRPYAFDSHGHATDVPRRRRGRGCARRAGPAPQPTSRTVAGCVRPRGGRRRRSRLRGGPRDIPDGPAKTRGIELGRAAAAAILALRAADGSDTTLLRSGRTHRARRLVSGASHRVSTSRSPRAGATSRRSCSATARSSAPGPPYAATTQEVHGGLQRDQAPRR